MDARYNEDVYFGAGPVYGSAAPELERPEPQVEERPRERVSIRTEARPVSRQGISLFALAGWIGVAVLVTALLLSYIELNTIADQTYAYSEELSDLTEQGTKLRIDYESTFKLDQVEEYATNILGMVPAENDQVRYLNDQNEDQAVILRSDRGSGGIGAKLRSIVTALSEYFN